MTEYPQSKIKEIFIGFLEVFVGLVLLWWPVCVLLIIGCVGLIPPGWENTVCGIGMVLQVVNTITWAWYFAFGPISPGLQREMRR